jgi:hypothetical protein
MEGVGSEGRGLDQADRVAVPEGADGVSGFRIGGLDGSASRPSGWPTDGRSLTVCPLDTLSWSFAESTWGFLWGGVVTSVVAGVSMFCSSLSDMVLTGWSERGGGLVEP